MPRIATWNVNSINARLANVLEWLRSAKPDVVLLQEIKCQDPAFPTEAVGDLGYNVATHGQKSYNGVAILSLRPLEDVVPRASRATRWTSRRATSRPSTCGVRVASIYLPNGNPIGTEKFAYKLAWMERLRAHAAALLELDEPVVLGGDFNVIPGAHGLPRPEGVAGRRAVPAGEPAGLPRAAPPGLHRGLSRAASRRSAAPTPSGTTRAAPSSSTTASASTICCCRRRPPTVWSSCTIDKDPRRQPKASDHTPVIVELSG